MVIGVNCHNVNPIVLESWQRIYESNTKVKFLGMVTSHFKGDLPSFMYRVNLERDAKTVFNYEKDSAFIRDLLSHMLEFDSQFYVYLNSDIILMPQFLTKVEKILKDYNTISLRKKNIYKVDKYIDVVNSEAIPYDGIGIQGRDGFVFKKDDLKLLLERLPDFLISECWWDVFINKFLQKCTYCYQDTELTSHIVHNIAWRKDSLGDRYNKFLFSNVKHGV